MHDYLSNAFCIIFMRDELFLGLVCRLLGGVKQFSSLGHTEGDSSFAGRFISSLPACESQSLIWRLHPKIIITIVMQKALAIL